MSKKAQGHHIFLDYTAFYPPSSFDGNHMLRLMQEAVTNSGAREVHAHVENFDGDLSPLGFAAVVLIDESHVTAHCYSESGLLAIDVFTCGDHDPDFVAEQIHERLISENDRIVLDRRQRIDRF